MKAWLGAALCFYIVFCVPVQLQAADSTMRVGAYDFPPYMIEDGYQLDNGVVGYGVDVDILLEVLNRAGYTHTLRWVPFKRLRVELMEKGSIDVSDSFFFDDEYPLSADTARGFETCFKALLKMTSNAFLSFVFPGNTFTATGMPDLVNVAVCTR